MQNKSKKYGFKDFEKLSQKTYGAVINHYQPPNKKKYSNSETNEFIIDAVDFTRNRGNKVIDELSHEIAKLSRLGQFDLAYEKFISSNFPIEKPIDVLMLAYIASARNDFELALNLLTADEERFPLSLDALVLLAHCYKNVSLFHGTIITCQRILEIDPDRPEILCELGFAYDKFSDKVSAFKTYKECVKKFPHYALGHSRISTMYAYLENVELCIYHAEKAYSLAPQNVHCFHTLIYAYRKSNNNTKAIELLKNVLQNENRPADLYSYVVLAKPKISDPFDENICNLLASGSLGTKDKIQLSYAKAMAHVNSGERREAVEIWNTAGKLDQDTRRYSLNNAQMQFADVYSAFTKSVAQLSLQDIKSVKADVSAMPIFIIGMPRSGTSLVEQIISSHSDVTGLGELEAFNKIFNVKNFLKSDINCKNLLRLREIYLEEVALFKPQTARFTDKMPSNFRYLGFMSAAFPEAKIIHIKRSPAAVCFSNFKTYFGAEGMLYSSSQADVVEYYKMYLDLMEFWRLTYSEKFIEIDYENLTEHPEETIRQILEYCELPYEQNCVDFQNSDRVVLTASQDQVKRGMYTGSSEEWRKYSDYIQPILKKLNDYGIKT